MGPRSPHRARQLLRAPRGPRPLPLELPEALILAETGNERTATSVRQWLAQCLDHAAQQSQQRLLAQDFCGVVISGANEQAITRYWVGLGDQRPPYSEDGVLFRYQDPRVMQRVWPSLSPSQQARWLGPVTQWWSLRQPWGPFSAAPEPAPWFLAKAPLPSPEAPSGGSPRDLFTQEQWFLAGVSPDANAIWRGYANNDVRVEAQPDAHSMVVLLADGARLGLSGVNLEDYVWSTWLHRPKEGAPRAMDWSLPHTAPVLTQVLKQLQAQPDARFSTLFAQAIRAGS